MSEIEEKSGHKEEQSWCSLSEDLVILVKSRLFAGDYSAFNAVCMYWRSLVIVRPLPPPVNCPFRSSACLMSIHNKEVKVYHPVYNDFYYMDIPELYGSKILSSKHGWLLVSVRNSITIFFFNPFTREKIPLPDIPFDCGFFSAAFTAPPTSHDCLVIGAKGIGSAHIALLRHGYRSWDTYGYAVNSEFADRFCCSASSPVFFNGLYYVLSSCGAVGVFDPSNPSEWKNFVKPLDFQYHSGSIYFLEMDGKLVGLFVSRHKVHIFSIDFTNNVWKPDKITGGENALYASHGSTFFRKSQVNGMSNKIYFPVLSGNNGVFYSLGTGIFRSFTGDIWTADTDKMKMIQNSVWIEPTFEKACRGEQLIW